MGSGSNPCSGVGVPCTRPHPQAYKKTGATNNIISYSPSSVTTSQTAVNMALWTPYADDSPLDLSMKSTSKSRSPKPTFTELPSRPCISTVQHSVKPYPYIGYVQPVYAPVAEPSPCSSSYEYPPPYGVPESTIPSTSTGIISPPDSPVLDNEKKRPSYMIDVDSLSDDPDFQAFERDALRAMAEKNGGTLLGNNPRMRRAVQSNQNADDSYRKQRERNNFAAKQSRDRRKLREIHLSLKVTYLKNELSKLKGLLSSNTCIRCHQTCLHQI